MLRKIVVQEKTLRRALAELAEKWQVDPAAMIEVVLASGLRSEVVEERMYEFVPLDAGEVERLKISAPAVSLKIGNYSARVLYRDAASEGAPAGHFVPRVVNTGREKNNQRDKAKAARAGAKESARESGG